MSFQLVGSPTSAANQLIAHLRTKPGFEDLFPEPDLVDRGSPGKAHHEMPAREPSRAPIQQQRGLGPPKDRQ